MTVLVTILTSIILMTLFIFIEFSSCVDGEVRLVNGSISQEGRVEVCVNGVWGTICGTGWSKTDAFVLCKQLGYTNSG